MQKERKGFLAEYDRKTAWQKIDMVSFHNLTVRFLEATRRGSGGPAGGGISQNVHTPAIFYPPTGRKIVVSYMHSQEPRAARPWPGTGGEICHPRACSAAGRLCILPPGCGGRQTTPRPRVLKIKKKSARSWYQLRADFFFIFNTRGRGVVCLPPQPGGSMHRRPAAEQARGWHISPPVPGHGLAARGSWLCI